jgi:NADH:ubiquinone oxidoreductase subunit E
VQILRDVMAIHNRIPPADITRLAQALESARARVEGVTELYAYRGTGPHGRYHVPFSDNTTQLGPCAWERYHLGGTHREVP